MKTKIQKWGNSLGVRLPKNITEAKSLKAGAAVSVVLKDNTIVIEPITPELSLDSLLQAISPDSLHQETEWTKPVGNEIW